MHDLVSDLKRAKGKFKGKVILYLQPFISTEKGAAETYKDDRQLQADGIQVCDYHGEYVGTRTNSYGKQLMEFVSLAMDQFGFDGICAYRTHRKHTTTWSSGMCVSERLFVAV